jgi:hypothetical protein
MKCGMMLPDAAGDVLDVIDVLTVDSLTDAS